ncbi:serine/threonine-protein kinase [Streptomyces sp. NPDC048330]|uniref:serine/threonine-protein kinase n=1 Tax=Streptomyces sp. NPDC048330 TaxID=3365533 RepID=UPI003721CFC9
MQPLAADDPRQVGEYRLLRQLGAGGMGRVYLGRTAGGRTVAVKVVRLDLADDPEFRARFRQEVAAARRVGGAWTAPVLDADTEGGHPWVATGYVAGPALTDAVQDFGPLPEPVVRTLGVGLAEALAHLHGLGLVHRDVKPSNVLLTLDGPRLIDFGIARALDATTVLTRSGAVFGSPGFMSPEQANGLPAGPASDVFSLGALLAYAATGTMPFGSGVSAPVLLYRVLHEEPDLSELPGPLHSLVHDCLAKDPSARPTPERLRKLLDDDGTAAARLGRGDWLPVALAAAVGRSAVQLLDLEGEGEPGEREAGEREGGEGKTGEGRAEEAGAGEAGTGETGAGAPRSPSASGFGPPVAAGFGPPTMAPGGPAGAYPPVPTTAPMSGPAAGATTGPVPIAGPIATAAAAPAPPGHPPSVPGHPPYPQRVGGRRRYGVPLAALVGVLLLGGGYLLFDQLRDDGRRDTSANPRQTTPSDDSSADSSTGAPTDSPTESSPPDTPEDPLSGSPDPSGGTPDPTEDSPDPDSTDTPGPDIVPAKYLGTWVGKGRGTDGEMTTVTLTIAQSASSEEKSKVRTETPATGTWCEAAWTLTDADASRASYASRVTRSSPGDPCATDESIYRLITMQQDGSLHYMDLLRQDRYIVLRKKG